MSVKIAGFKHSLIFYNTLPLEVRRCLQVSTVPGRDSCSILSFCEKHYWCHKAPSSKVVNAHSIKAREEPCGSRARSQESSYSYLYSLAEQLVSPNQKAKAALPVHSAKEASREHQATSKSYRNQRRATANKALFFWLALSLLPKLTYQEVSTSPGILSGPLGLDKACRTRVISKSL